MQVTVKEFSNSEVTIYRETGKEDITIVSLFNLPLSLLELIEGKQTLEKVDEILQTHTLVNVFKVGDNRAPGSDTIWKNAERFFQFISNEVDYAKRIAVIVPYHKVRFMTSQGYALGVDLGSVNKRVMTLNVEAYKLSRIKLSPFAWDTIEDRLNVTEDNGDNLSYSLVMSDKLPPNDLLRIEGKKTARVLLGINDEPTDLFVNNFTNSEFDESLNTLEQTLKFVQKHKQELIDKKVRRLVFLLDTANTNISELPEVFKKVMTVQELNKYVVILNVKQS